jgi:hypothetical protein
MSADPRPVRRYAKRSSRPMQSHRIARPELRSLSNISRVRHRVYLRRVELAAHRVLAHLNDRGLKNSNTLVHRLMPLTQASTTLGRRLSRRTDVLCAAARGHPSRAGRFRERKLPELRWRQQ